MRILWSSDHHTLHGTTPTSHILKNLSTFFYVDNDLKKVDMVVFGGDFMERLVESSNPDLFKVKEWGKEFLEKCHEENVAVIFLEGTSSHDWGQPKHFEYSAPKGMNFRYVDTLRIDVFPEFDNLSVMYVPDNFGKQTPDEIWELALKVLADSGLGKVDLIFFHGGWIHQLPPQVHHKCHMEERWESIVTFGIFSGHIHIPSQLGKIYNSGSFDRTRHGEEHPKGGYIVDLDKKTNHFDPRFYENKGALPYVTLRITEDILPEELVITLHQFIKQKKLPHHACVRIMGGRGEVTRPVLAIMGDEYPYLQFKAENVLSKDMVADDTLFTQDKYQGVKLTKQNLEANLLPEIQGIIAQKSLDQGNVLRVLREFL